MHKTNEESSELEFSRMLTLSTGHITHDTAKWLDTNIDKLAGLYNKDEYGWFIYVICCIDENWETYANLPKDLQEVIDFCIDNDVDILCLDGDGNETDKLPVYDW